MIAKINEGRPHPSVGIMFDGQNRGRAAVIGHLPELISIRRRQDQ